MRLFDRRQQFPGFLLAAVVGLTTCPVLAEVKADADKDTHAAHHQNDWPGIYFGFTPCADCVGIKTSLALNKNNSYILITQYAGKSDREFVEKGKYSLGDKPNTIVLAPRKGDTQQQYLVDGDALVQLDSAGNRITGKNAERYILRRTDVTELTQSQSHGH